MRMILTLLAGIMLLTVQLPTFASNAEVEVTVTIPQIFCLSYEPILPYTTNHVIFNITLDDMLEESVSIVNHGNLKWCSTIENWKITVHRSPWKKLSGSPDFGWYLEIKYGPPENYNWLEVTTDEMDWYWSKDVKPPEYPIGEGKVPNIDWKIKDLLWEWSPPGSYECTVYFTIMPDP